MKKLLKALFIFFVMFSSNINVNANETQDFEALIEKIIEISGLSDESVRNDVATYADIEQITEVESASYLLKELEINLPEKKEVSNITKGTVYFSYHEPGDVFYTDSYTSFVNHGHSGIYYSVGIVVEAPGYNKNVRTVATDEMPLTSGYTNVVQLVATQNFGSTRYSSTIRDAVSIKALGYKGRGYNASLINKTCGGTLNCSQLVWCAWNGNVDLDNTPGDSTVLPLSIRDSYRTYTIESK